MSSTELSAPPSGRALHANNSAPTDTPLSYVKQRLAEAACFFQLYFCFFVDSFGRQLITAKNIETFS
jgi:hypothetical protein